MPKGIIATLVVICVITTVVLLLDYRGPGRETPVQPTVPHGQNYTTDTKPPQPAPQLSPTPAPQLSPTLPPVPQAHTCDYMRTPTPAPPKFVCDCDCCNQ